MIHGTPAMTRRVLLSLTLAAGLALAAPLAGGAAFAQSTAAATITQAKTAGEVGEQGDGYLGLVSAAAPAEVKAAVAEINAGRAKAYQDIAAKTGVSAQAAGEATARQLIAKVPAGGWYKPLGGEWTKR